MHAVPVPWSLSGLDPVHLRRRLGLMDGGFGDVSCSVSRGLHVGLLFGFPIDRVGKDLFESRGDGTRGI